jgi:hypothetical protein
MAVRFYLMPAAVTIIEGSIFRGPKYLKRRWHPEDLDVRWSGKDYGSIDLYVCAVDGTAADHAFLAAQSDTFAFPEDLEGAMSQADRAALSDYLEIVYVPADWITPSDSYRSALRTVTAMFLLMQRLTAMTGNVSPLEWGVGLNDQFRTLAQQYQDAIMGAFSTMGYDTGVIRANWTLRVILKNAADQWADRPILFGFVTL